MGAGFYLSVQGWANWSWSIEKNPNQQQSGGDDSICSVLKVAIDLGARGARNEGLSPGCRGRSRGTDGEQRLNCITAHHVAATAHL